MPLYTYRNQKTGATVELNQPIAERDSVPGHERIQEYPSAVKVINPSAGGPQSLQVRQVLNGYKRLEDQGKLKKSRREADKIKDAWKLPVVPDPVPSGAL
jgi:hypothetical protein